MSDIQTIFIVSGLPRSGTSMMMQILHAGGIPVLSDSLRPADANNPRGYFEYEKVKGLAKDNSWLGDARGKALKVIVQLLPFLDRRFKYKLLLMRRDLEEVLVSQSKMIASTGKVGAVDSQLLAQVFERNLAAVPKIVSAFPDMLSHSVEFSELVQSPELTMDQVLGFLDLPSLDRNAMIRAVDAKLYRTKIAPDSN